MKKYLRKNVPFDPENEEEKELYEWLQSLPYGQFSELTKHYWKSKMDIDKLSKAGFPKKPDKVRG